MSDERLRELERRWKETGAAQDEAAYLLERVRVGELERGRLELAGYCGYEAATSTRPPPDDDDDLGLRVWEITATWGSEAGLRATVVAMRLLCERRLEIEPRYPASRLGFSLEVAKRLDAYLASPSQQRLQAIGKGRSGAVHAIPVQQFVALGVCEAARHEWKGLGKLVSKPLPSLTVSEPEDFCRRVWQAVCAELIPWALGYSDPVRERAGE